MAVIPIPDQPSIIARLDDATTTISQLVAATGEPTLPVSTSTGTSTPTSTPSVSEATNTASKGLSIGAKVGIGISVTITILSVIAIVTWFAVKYMRRRRHELRMQTLRRESERGMRNAAAFQYALPPEFLEREDTSYPPKPPPKPPKPVPKLPTKRGFSWLNEKEVVVDWRTNMSTRFSRWRNNPSVDELDPQLKKGWNSPESLDSWI